MIKRGLVIAVLLILNIAIAASVDYPTHSTLYTNEIKPVSDPPAGSGITASTTVTINAAGKITRFNYNGDYLDVDLGKFIVKSDGKVGIGTTSPDYKLHVVNNIDGAPTVIFENDQADVAPWDKYTAIRLKDPSNWYSEIRAVRVGNLAFVVNGGSAVEAMRIDSTGDVGIGTASPLTRLHTKGTQIAGGAFTGVNQGIVRISGDAWVNTDIVAIDFGSAFGVEPASSNPLARIGAEVTGGGSYLHFGTSNNYAAGITNKAMTIGPSGNVGIGTTNPTVKLDVAGQVRTGTAGGSGNGMLVQFSPGLSGAYSNLYAMSGVDDTLVLQSYSKPLAINPLGNAVGIGTASPTQTLDVAGYVKGQGLCIGGDCRTSWPSGGTSQWIGTGNIYYSGGNVGIGTASPSAPLDVVGPATGNGITIRASGGGDVVLNPGGSLFFDGNYNYGAGNYIRPVAANTQTFVTAGQERMRITSGGNVGIGTAAPLGGLDVETGSWVYLRSNVGPSSPNPSGSINYGLMFAWNPSNGYGESQILYGTGAGAGPRLDFGRWTGAGKTIDMTLYNGNVGIGMTNPDEKLRVVGTIRASNILSDGSINGYSLSIGSAGISTNGGISASGGINAGVTGIYSNGDITTSGKIYATGGGISPNYDSGWFVVNSLTGSSYEILKAHNFGTVPSQFMLLQCGSLSGSTCISRQVLVGTRGDFDGGYAINPIAMTSDYSYIYIGIINGWAAWGYWTPSGNYMQGDADGNAYTGYYRILAWK